MHDMQVLYSPCLYPQSGSFNYMLVKFARHHACTVPVLVMLALLPLPTCGRTWHVPSECTTIQGALDTLQAQDTVLVELGSYRENLLAPALAFVLRGAAVLDSAEITCGRSSFHRTNTRVNLLCSCLRVLIPCSKVSIFTTTTGEH